MKLKDMVPGIRYLVTEGSRYGSFQVGDHIKLEPLDNSITCFEAGGGLTENEWRRIRKCEVEFDEAYYLKMIEKKANEIADYQNLIARHKGISLHRRKIM